MRHRHSTAPVPISPIRTSLDSWQLSIKDLSAQPKSVKGRNKVGETHLLLKAVIYFCLPMSLATWLQKGPHQSSLVQICLCSPCNHLLIWRWTTSLHPLETHCFGDAPRPGKRMLKYCRWRFWKYYNFTHTDLKYNSDKYIKFPHFSILYINCF